MKRSKIQVWTTIALLTVPLIMIWLNGTKAMSALFWSSPAQDSIPVVEVAHLPSKELEFGIYDPGAHWKDSTVVWDYRQIYLHWLNFDLPSTLAKIRKYQELGAKVIVIVEPWSKISSSLFPDVIAGKYNSQIGSIKTLIDNVTEPVYMSWGHEMDQDLTQRYDWSTDDSSGYIRAYRYVHNKVNSEKVEWIWAPVGKDDCNNYWPGATFVDVIGLPIYSLPQFDYEYYGKIRSFRESFGEKYNLVKRYNKPIFLLEFGVSGSSDFEAYWVREAFQNFDEFQLLETVIFFNSPDTEGAWGENYTTPDWTINHEVVSAYVHTYRNRNNMK